MAKNRFINTKFWSDGYVVNLDIPHRYLFLYFLTNSHTHICGIYELPLPLMVAETIIGEKTLIEMIKKLEGKVFYINGWIYLRNFTKHQTKSETIEKGIKAGRDLVPKKIMDEIYTIDTLYLHEQVSESELESNNKYESKVGPASKEAKKGGHGGMRGIGDLITNLK